MLILLANDRNALRLAQDGPTAHRAARHDAQGPERAARRGGDPRRSIAKDAEALAHAA